LAGGTPPKGKRMNDQRESVWVEIIDQKLLAHRSPHTQMGIKLALKGEREGLWIIKKRNINNIELSDKELTFDDYSNKIISYKKHKNVLGIKDIHGPDYPSRRK
jgi:hypothetical protein